METLLGFRNIFVLVFKYELSFVSVVYKVKLLQLSYSKIKPNSEAYILTVVMPASNKKTA